MTDTPPAPPAPVRTFAWPKLIPDLRVVVAFGYIALVWRLIDAVVANPRLLAVPAMITLITLLAGGGGLGLITAFLYGGTKTGSDVMKAQNDAVINSPPPARGPGQ